MSTRGERNDGSTCVINSGSTDTNCLEVILGTQTARTLSARRRTDELGEPENEEGSGGGGRALVKERSSAMPIDPLPEDYSRLC